MYNLLLYSSITHYDALKTAAKIFINEPIFHKSKESYHEIIRVYGFKSLNLM